MRPLLLILLISNLLFSSHEKKKETSNSKQIGLIDKSLNKIEDKLKIVYEKLNLSSKYIDEFLTNQSDDSIYTKSYIRIESSIEKISSKNVDLEPDIDIRIILPKLKDKLSLTIDNIENKIHQESQDSNETIEYRNSNNYNIGLLYNTTKKDIKLKFKLGVKTSSNPYIFAKADAKKIFKIDDLNTIILKEELRYSNRYKLDNYSSIEYIYKFSPYLFFSNYNEYYINSKEKNNNFYNSFRIEQKLPKKQYINYVTSINTDDENSNLKIKEYKTYLSYRKYLKKWLYYDIVPSINWERENSFDEELGIKFTLGILISE